MIGKWFAGLFLAFLCVSFSFAQSLKAQNETHWEFLEVSGVSRSCEGIIYESDVCRHYNYPGSGLGVSGPAPLDWMSESGWELVGIVTPSESPMRLFFKRRYHKARTEKEIEWLKKELKKNLEGISGSWKSSRGNLIDLDALEVKQKIDAYNQSEEAKLRAALEQIKGLPLKIISVSSKAGAVGQKILGAEIVLDATSVLLADGNKYRSSEVVKYYNESVNQILDQLNVTEKKVGTGKVVDIAKSSVMPAIGNFYFYRAGLTLKVSIVINYQNQQNVVAQGGAEAKWINNAQ